MADKIQLDLEYFCPDRYRRGPKPSSGHIEGNLPAVVDPGGQGQPDLANNLGPELQGHGRIAPSRIRQIGPNCITAVHSGHHAPLRGEAHEPAAAHLRSRAAAGEEARVWLNLARHFPLFKVAPKSRRCCCAAQIGKSTMFHKIPLVLGLVGALSWLAQPGTAQNSRRFMGDGGRSRTGSNTSPPGPVRISRGARRGRRINCTMS